MKTVLIFVLLVAVILGIIALVDQAAKRLLRRHVKKHSRAVRMPGYNLLLGLLVCVVGVLGLLLIPPAQERVVWLGSWIVLIMGMYLLVNHFWFGIFYDDEGFTVRQFPAKARAYRFADITGQKTFAARSGWNACLYVAGEEVQLYASQQGVAEFMEHAFLRWCEARGLDPEDQSTDPDNLVYFPQL